MGELMSLIAVRAAEGSERIKLEASTEPPYQVTVHRERQAPKIYADDNLFACLLSARRDLEREGLLLCCQGARCDVTNSGMQAQMTGGRFVYTFDMASRTVNEETVDIFAPARSEEVTTVSDQRAAIFEFFRLKDRGRDI